MIHQLRIHEILEHNKQAPNASAIHTARIMRKQRRCANATTVSRNVAGRRA